MDPRLRGDDKEYNCVEGLEQAIRVFPNLTRIVCGSISGRGDKQYVGATRQRLTGLVPASSIAAAWIVVHAIAVLAVPAPRLPAIGTIVDAQRFPSAFTKDGKSIAPFVPIAITGRGFDAKDSAAALRVLTSDCEWAMHTLT